jgi:hypothetical protein
MSRFISGARPSLRWASAISLVVSLAVVGGPALADKQPRDHKAGSSSGKPARRINVLGRGWSRLLQLQNHGPLGDPAFRKALRVIQTFFKAKGKGASAEAITIRFKSLPIELYADESRPRTDARTSPMAGEHGSQKEQEAFHDEVIEVARMIRANEEQTAFLGSRTERINR